MRGTDTIKALTAADLTPVRLCATSNYSQGTSITLAESIANFSQLLFQFGTPSTSNTSGYETVSAYPWQINATFSASNPRFSFSVHGEHVTMTLDSLTAITYTSGSANLRCIFGIRK